LLSTPPRPPQHRWLVLLHSHRLPSSSSIINLHRDVWLPPSTICTSSTVPVHLQALALLLSRPPAVLSVHFFCDGCSLPPCRCGRRVQPHL
jgi:hypothetical protein